MKSCTSIFRNLFLFADLFILSFLVLSCENKTDFIPKSDFITLPSLSGKDINTIYTDSGRLQLIMSTPFMEQYDNKDFPHSDFKSGIKVLYYDGKPKPVASATAKYARYTNKDNLWELRDSVVVVNETNDKLETEVLYWNQGEDRIYTDRFVKITNEDQIIQGFGFESDARLIHRRIKRVTATIYLKDEG